MDQSPLVSLFVEQGVPSNSIQYLLLFPIIATFVAFARQVIGIKAFGIYTPTIIAFAFLAIANPKYFISIYIVVVAVGLITRNIIKRFRLLYLPRVAITMTVISLSVLIALVIGGYLQRTGLAIVSAFPLLIMITLVEKFVAVQSEKGTRIALFLAVETFIIALLGYAILEWEYLTELVLRYPWGILLVIPFNIFLGKWTGLRLTEYVRFREILKKQ